MELTNQQMDKISLARGILKDTILSNHGNSIENVVRIFEDLVKQHDIGVIVQNFEIKEDELQVKLGIDNMSVSFKLDLNVPVEDSYIQKMIDECEPWRKNPKLAESDRRIKEWANKF